MPTSLIGGLIGAAGSLFGGNAASDAAKQAAQTQMAMFRQNQANAQPWISAGQNALGVYGNAIGLNGSGPQASYFNSFQNDPYFTGIKNAGIQGIENSDLARGRGYGGNVLNDLNRYSMDIQKSAYDTRLGQLAGVSQQGQGAAGALANNGAYAANAAGNYLTASGTYTGASYQNAANALGAGFNNFAKANPNFISNNMSNMFMPANSFAA